MDIASFLISLQGLTNKKDAVNALETQVRRSILPVVPTDPVEFVESTARLSEIETADAYKTMERGIQLYGEGKQAAGLVTIARGYDALGRSDDAASYLATAALVAPDVDKPLVAIAQAEYDFYRRRETEGIQKPLEAALGIYRDTKNSEEVRRQAQALLSSAHEELVEENGIQLSEIPVLAQFMDDSEIELLTTQG